MNTAWGWGAGGDSGATEKLQMQMGDTAAKDYGNSETRLKLSHSTLIWPKSTNKTGLITFQA